MRIKKEEDLTIVISDLNGLVITSEISKNRYAELTLIENGNIEQYSLDINEIDLIIKHLEKTKEILKQYMQ